MKIARLSKITFLFIIILSGTFLGNKLLAQQKMIGPYLQKMAHDEVTIS